MTNREPSFLSIGLIVAPHGCRGEVKVNPETDWPERYTAARRLFLEEKGTVPRAVAVERVRYHKNQMIIKLAGIEDRGAAEKLRGRRLFIPREEAVELPEGHYFLHQIKGLVVETTEGLVLGTIKEVLCLPANDVYVLESHQKEEILLPATREVVKKIDVEAGKMIVHLLPGLLPGEEP